LGTELIFRDYFTPAQQKNREAFMVLLWDIDPEASFIFKGNTSSAGGNRISRAAVFPQPGTELNIFSDIIHLHPIFGIAVDATI
jgi:hypothetical protein